MICVCLWCSTGDGGGGGGVITDAEIRALSETLYALDSNKASASELIIDPQALVPNSQTSSQSDLSSELWEDNLSSTAFLSLACLLLYLDVFTPCFCASSLFRYLNEEILFSRPTYAALLAVLDNYHRRTGQAEDFSAQQVAEQETFLRETMSNTELGRELFAFLYTKGNSVYVLYTGFQSLTLWHCDF